MSKNRTVQYLYVFKWTPWILSIPTNMVSVWVWCNVSQVQCVKKYPWCDPCYTLVVVMRLLLLLLMSSLVMLFVAGKLEVGRKRVTYLDNMWQWHWRWTILGNCLDLSHHDTQLLMSQLLIQSHFMSSWPFPFNIFVE